MKKEIIFSQIDYMQIFQNRTVIETIKGEEIEGKTKKDIGEYLGSKYGQGKFTLKYKNKGEGEVKICPLVSIVYHPKNSPAPAPAPSQHENNSSQFLELLKYQLELTRETLKELKTELREEKEFNRKIILSENNSNDNSGTLDMITGLIGTALQKMNGANKTAPALADNNTPPGEMPGEIKELINQIDWSKVNVSQVLNLVKQFSSQIPFKT